MKIFKTMACVGMCLGLLVVVGCEEKYKLTWINATGNDIDVTLMGPGSISPSHTLTIPASGEMPTFVIKVDPDDGVKYTWSLDFFKKFDDQRGNFVIDKDTKKKLRMTIMPNGKVHGPHDENVEFVGSSDRSGTIKSTPKMTVTPDE